MRKKEDRNTRYFIDLDLEERTILGWDYDQKERLAAQTAAKPSHRRIYITRGQYKKLVQEPGRRGLGSASAK
jgi:hypothetical protein